MRTNYLSKIALAIMLFVCFTASAETIWIGPSGAQLGFTLNGDEACLVSIPDKYDVTKTDGVLTIPASFSKDGTTYTVTSIKAVNANSGVWNKKDNATYGTITTVNIPATVKTIGDYAFTIASTVKEFKIDEGSCLESIGIRSFNKCSAMESIDLPSTLISVGERAFSECSALKEAKFSEGLINIDTYAFGNCYGLEKVYLPKSLNLLSKFLFFNCIGLKEVHLAHEQKPSLGEVTSLDNIFKVNNCPGITDGQYIGKNATLYVPSGCAESEFGAETVWGKFFVNIVEEATSSAKPNAASSVKAYSAEGNIIVTGATEGTALAVYSVTGQLVHKSTMTSADASLQLPAGLYLVKVGNSVFKTVNK